MDLVIEMEKKCNLKQNVAQPVVLSDWTSTFKPGGQGSIQGQGSIP